MRRIALFFLAVLLTAAAPPPAPVPIVHNAPRAPEGR